MEYIFEKVNYSVIIFCLIFFGVGYVYGDELKPTVITVHKSDQNTSNSYVVGLVNMDNIMSDCNQMVGTIKIENYQFSESGLTLQQFSFRDNKNNLFSVPTNIAELSKFDVEKANSIFKIGDKYLAHVQFCGSGGYGSLINIYDLNSTMGNLN